VAAMSIHAMLFVLFVESQVVGLFALVGVFLD
jgi:hypothetical protein